MAPSSNGQDNALSRRRLEFDSRQRHQDNGIVSSEQQERVRPSSQLEKDQQQLNIFFLIYQVSDVSNVLRKKIFIVNRLPEVIWKTQRSRICLSLSPIILEIILDNLYLRWFLMWKFIKHIIKDVVRIIIFVIILFILKVI